MSIADRIIEKCGGVARTAELVGRSESWVYRWTYAREKGGTGGNVPRSAQEALLEASRQGKVEIEPADFFDTGEAA
jgi:hypothetical protein